MDSLVGRLLIDMASIKHGARRVVALAFFVCATAGFAKTYPALLGVNVAGSYHMVHATSSGTFYEGQLFYHQAAWYKATAELGVKFVDINFLMEHNCYSSATDTEQTVADRLAYLDAQMRAHGLKYSLSTDLAAWNESLFINPLVDEFYHSDGTHRWDYDMAWLTPLLTGTTTSAQAFLGINYDEGDVNQILGTENVTTSTGTLTYDKPTFLDVDGLNIEAAWTSLAARMSEIRESHYEGKVPCFVEGAFPDMQHIFARAGWIVCPKLLSQELSSVQMAIALGAALQYAGEGTDLWTCSDMWRMDEYPGWSPSALRSALLMSYWLGASTIYVENFDYADSTLAADPSYLGGSLVRWTNASNYVVTTHGAVVKDFFKNYVPKHARNFNWSSYRPKVAIIRLPDGDWGQSDNVCFTRQRLLGSRTLAPSEASQEWLQVWPILTHGVASSTGITLFDSDYYTNYGWSYDFPFFVPLDSVAVFDHTVTGSALDSVECFVVCGEALSAATFAELKTRVAAGATCIIAKRLYKKYASGTLPGDWLVVDGFASHIAAIKMKLEPFLGPDYMARFRFEDYTVSFQPDNGDKDKLVVTVTTNAAAASPDWSLYK
jgi:hypothetical protein